ncbi:hypothetical protein PILCRDRAFT_12875 [Piloderma croceum F 1598]|uniref:Uncharacterized protein n=1 Tax=Piloderma croceum (strain F 1598) TaxID=765440 RepID=A0A0C3AQR3_PILCF|nr:hypothetical protein PILCRDRAFT_12875 [Piloderma croceum F 1598]
MVFLYALSIASIWGLHHLGLAFPLPDVVHTHIVSSPSLSGNTTEDAEALYLCFLAGLFSKVNEKLERCHAEEQHGDKTMTDWWRDHLRQPDTRQQLYSSVVENAAGLKQNTFSALCAALGPSFKPLYILTRHIH